MSTHYVEDFDRVLENLQEAQRQIESIHKDRIDVEELYLLSSVVIEVMGWTRSAYGEDNMGINPSLLNKFLKLHGTVSKRDALGVANRVKTYLKTEPPTYSQEDPEPVLEKPVAVPAQSRIEIIPEKWIVVSGDSEMKKKISALAVLLDSIIQQVKFTNAPPNEQALSELERQQLIAILETAVNVLRSPVVEKGLLKKASELMRSSAEKAAEKKVQEGLGGLMSVAGRLLWDIVKALAG